MEAVWRIVKVYVDGHIWMEKEEGEAPPDLAKMFEEPGLVMVEVTRQSIRRER